MRRGTLVLVSLIAAVGTLACGDDNGTGPPSGLQPEALSVSPDSGNVGTRVEITGSSFEQGAGVAFDGIPSGTVEFVDATTLLAFAPEGLEADSLYDVTVINPGGMSDVLADAYKAVGPALLVVNGVSKPSGNTGSTVILEGKAFGDLDREDPDFKTANAACADVFVGSGLGLGRSASDGSQG